MATTALMIFGFTLVAGKGVAAATMTFDEAAKMTMWDATLLLEEYQPPPRGGWTSQCGQDRWAALYAGLDMGPAAQRFFVEVGAADGLTMSNTMWLEQLGWRGVCIEASPSAVGALRRNRPNCLVMDAVVGARSGEVLQTHSSRFSKNCSYKFTFHRPWVIICLKDPPFRFHLLPLCVFLHVSRR